jgi:hypothetical protein
MAAKKKKAGRPKGSKNVKKKVAKKGKRGRPKGAKNVKKKAKKRMGRPKGSKNVKKKAKKKAGRPKAAKRRASTKTRTVTISASLADKIEGLTLLGKGGAIEKAIDKLIK